MESSGRFNSSVAAGVDQDRHRRCLPRPRVTIAELQRSAVDPSSRGCKLLKRRVCDRQRAGAALTSPVVPLMLPDR
jgi:hypothetical protein